MVSLNFEKSNFSITSLASPSLSGYASGKNLTFGIWEGKLLVRVFSLNTDEQAYLKSKIEGLNPREINFVHDSDIFEHVEFDSFEPHNLKQYFSGDDAIKLQSYKPAYEKLKQQKVFTLTGESKELSQTMETLGMRTKVLHASTALANLVSKSKDQMLILISESQIQLVVHKDKKFHLFEQHRAQSATDYLYYILLAAKRLNINVADLPVVIGGAIDQSSPLYTLLKSYIHNLEFYKSTEFNVEGTNLPLHYYLPLIIARACA